MDQESRGFFKLLAKAKPAYRKKLLAGAPNQIIDILAKCAMNILQGHIILTRAQKEKLRPHKNTLRSLANKKASTRQKRIILQKGGLFGLDPLKLVPTMLKGINHGTMLFSKVRGVPEPYTDMEMADNDVIIDNMFGNAAKAHQLLEERDRKANDGTYAIMDAIRKNPGALVQTYRDLKKQGKI